MSSELSRWRRPLDWIVIGLFVSASIAPTIDQFVRPDSARGPTTELRSAAPRPEWPTNWEHVSKFPQAYDAYYADTFGLRDVLLRWNSLDKFFVFQTAPSKTLVLGKDQWIFYSGDESIPIYRGLMPFHPVDLQTWGRQLELRRSALAARGIDYVFVIVPNKETIYPEKMPDAINRVGPTRREQFVAWMRRNSKVDVLDLTESFRAEKAHDSPGSYLYNQHGTHWTGRGSYLGYRELVQHIGKLRPSIAPLPAVELEWREGDGLRDTWSKSMYIQDVLHERDIEPVRIGGFHREFPADQGTRATSIRMRALDAPEVRALVFHDSFGPYVRDLLGEHFSRLCMDWAHYDTALVSDEEPDVVVEMYVERIFVVPTPGPGESERAYELKSAFERLPVSLIALGEPGTRDFDAIAGMKLETVHADGKSELVFTSKDSKQGALSPAFAVPSTGEVWLQLEASAARATSLDVYWKPADAATFGRKAHAVLDLSTTPLRQRLQLKLPAGPSRVFLRPHDPDVEIRVEGFEVRAANAP